MKPGCRIGNGIRVPVSAVVAAGSVVEGDVEIGTGVVLINATVAGAGRVKTFAVIRNMGFMGADRNVEILIR